jgi:hypothetical protein
MLGNSWVVAQLAASRKGLSSIELFSGTIHTNKMYKVFIFSVTSLLWMTTRTVINICTWRLTSGMQSGMMGKCFIFCASCTTDLVTCPDYFRVLYCVAKMMATIFIISKLYYTSLHDWIRLRHWFGWSQKYVISFLTDWDAIFLSTTWIIVAVNNGRQLVCGTILLHVIRNTSYFEPEILAFYRSPCIPYGRGYQHEIPTFWHEWNTFLES